MGDRCHRHRETPVEGQAQPGLRPPGNALHERIGGDQSQRHEAENDGQDAQLHQNAKADQRADDDEGNRLFRRDLARRDWTATRPFDLGVDIAIDQVVKGAAGGAHQRRADCEQSQFIEGEIVRQSGGIEAGQPRIYRVDGEERMRHGEGQTHGARQEQQPDADRPVEPPKLQPRPQKRGRAAVDPVGLGGVGKRGCAPWKFERGHGVLMSRTGHFVEEKSG